MRQFSTRSIYVLSAVAIAALALVPLATGHSDRQTRAAATTIQVKGGEFYFKLSS